LLAGFIYQILHRKRIHLEEISFLHPTEYSVVVLVRSSSIIIFVIISNGLIFHLDIAVKLDSVAGVTLSLARVLACSQGRTRKVGLAQILSRDERHWRSIERESDWHSSGCTGRAEAA
jgi:hypothetical protein